MISTNVKRAEFEVDQNRVWKEWGFADLRRHLHLFGSEMTIIEWGTDSALGSYLRLIDFVSHSILGLRVIKKKSRVRT